jgi:hypothetical protein
MLKYLSKITMDILPSVVATIIGAYIVNHYIATKPAANAPVAAAASTTEPKKVEAASVDPGNIPAAGVHAKGISLKAIFEKSAADKPKEKQAEKQPEKPAEKPALAEKSPEKSLEPEDRSAETASISADIHHRPAAAREKEKAVRVIPLTAAAQPAVQPAASVATPPAPTPTVEAAITPDEHRDANDLARAAIERLRGSNEGAPRAQESVRVPDAPARTASVPQAPVPQAAAIRPLPPPIVVSTPPTDGVSAAPAPMQPYPMTARADDPRRPIPPADIPPPAPVDLRTDKPHTNVAEDMLLAAKSVFHSVIPQ